MYTSLQPALAEFGLTGEPRPLAFGTTQTYRIGDVVLKQIHETSLENNHSPQLASWIADFSSRVVQDGFRLPQPLRNLSGEWITPSGWTAMTYLPGRYPTAEDLPACIAGVAALHKAIRLVPKNPLMDDNRTAWGFAQRHSWGEMPDRALQPQLAELVERLYALRRPIQTAPWQVIHGDISPENILIAPGQPPAFIDFSPYFAPPEFAIALLAHFAGPRRFNMAVLAAFERLPNFKQLLIRAALRMLLVVSALDGLDGWDESEEKWAAEHIIQYVS